MRDLAGLQILSFCPPSNNVGHLHVTAGKRDTVYTSVFFYLSTSCQLTPLERAGHRAQSPRPPLVMKLYSFLEVICRRGNPKCYPGLRRAKNIQDRHHLLAWTHGGMGHWEAESHTVFHHLLAWHPTYLKWLQYNCKQGIERSTFTEVWLRSGHCSDYTADSDHGHCTLITKRSGPAHLA